MMKQRFLALLFLAFTSVATMAQEKQNNFEIAKSIDIYNSLLRELNLNYVDEINPGELNEAAINAMLAGLDPYTVFIPESNIEDARFLTTGEYGGIGALIQYDGEYTRISDPYEGWPAQKADLRAGDVILEINGIDCHKKMTAQVSELLKGQPGTDVTLKIKRFGKEKPITMTLKREKVKIDDIPYFTVFENGVGYVALNGFTRDAGAKVKAKLVEMKKEHELKGFILDLRGNGGGLMNEAVDIVNLFIGTGKPVVSMKGKTASSCHQYSTNNPSVDEDLPLAILVDGSSASASEIVAGAIQDYDRGIIIGTRTFGKGLVQNILPLSYNSQMKVTVAKYYIPSGRCIQEIDYSHKKDSTLVKADSLGKAFTTMAGRTVYEGHGIMPDVTMKRDPYATVTAFLYGKNMIFDYATKFHSEHPSIAAAKDFEIDEATYHDFMDFVKAHDFSYTTACELEMAQLKAAMEIEGCDKQVADIVKALEKALEAEKANDLQNNRDDIEELLRSEIASRYYYQKGRIEAALNTDPELKRAFEILLNTNGEDEYHTLLTK